MKFFNFYAFFFNILIVLSYFSFFRLKKLVFFFLFYLDFSESRFRKNINNFLSFSTNCNNRVFVGWNIDLINCSVFSISSTFFFSFKMFKKKSWMFGISTTIFDWFCFFISSKVASNNELWKLSSFYWKKYLFWKKSLKFVNYPFIHKTFHSGKIWKILFVFFSNDKEIVGFQGHIA